MMTYYRINIKIISIIFLLVFLYSCAPKIQTIPEVTHHLKSKEIYTFSADVPVLKLLENESHFVIINGRGTISKVEIASGELKFIFQLKFAIHPEIFSRGDLVVLRGRSGKNLVVFDIREMKILHSLVPPGKGKCIGVNTKGIIWSKENKAIIHTFTPDKTKIEIETGQSKVFNCRFSNSSIFLPTPDSLYIIDTNTWEYTKTKLPLPCNSDILLDGNFIYYGSKNRFLIKYEPQRNKIHWRFLLTKNLLEAPIKLSNHIACTPEDQNIYFISTTGTLDWWQKLDSTRLLSPVVMGNNVAVFLFPPESPQVKYFNFQNQETFSYKLDYLIHETPIYFGHELFILKGKKEGKQKKVIGIAKIGNRFEVDIKTDPKRLLSTGKSIKFILKPVNLIEPVFDVSILNAKKESIFNKKIIDAEKAQFNWIPEIEGEYEVTVDTKTENGKEIKSTHSFSVLDTDTLLLDHYLKLQQGCGADIFNKKAKGKHAKNH